VTGNDRRQIGVRKSEGDEDEVGEQSEDHADMAHAAVEVRAGICVLLCFFVLMVMVANMLDHRIMLMLTVRTHRRCSSLQGHHGDQHKRKEGSHAPEFTSFATRHRVRCACAALGKSCDAVDIQGSTDEIETDTFSAKSMVISA
jgi:hypothetical protein